jgi:hypothetical protein
MVPQVVPQRVPPSVDLRGLFGYMDVVNATSNGLAPSPHRHRGHIGLIRKAVWLIRWEERRCPNTNKRIRRTKRVYGSKKDAEHALTAELKRIDAGRPARQTRLTVDDWFKEHFDEWCKELSPRTLHGYRAVIKTVRPQAPAPAEARRPVAVRPAGAIQRHVRAWVISPTTVRGLRAVVRSAPKSRDEARVGRAQRGHARGPSEAGAYRNSSPLRRKRFDGSSRRPRRTDSRRYGTSWSRPGCGPARHWA